jgi:hypothetical protein
MEVVLVMKKEKGSLKVQMERLSDKSELNYHLLISEEELAEF